MPGTIDPSETTWLKMRSVITVDELAHGLRVNRKTAYDAVRRGEIPGAQRVGRTIRISRDAVLQWLRGQGRGPLRGGKP